MYSARVVLGSMEYCTAQCMFGARERFISRQDECCCFVMKQHSAQSGSSDWACDETFRIASQTQRIVLSVALIFCNYCAPYMACVSRKQNRKWVEFGAKGGRGCQETLIGNNQQSVDKGASCAGRPCQENQDGEDPRGEGSQDGYGASVPVQQGPNCPFWCRVDCQILRG
jgi:hypothetical protein